MRTSLAFKHAFAKMVLVVGITCAATMLDVSSAHAEQQRDLKLQQATISEAPQQSASGRFKLKARFTPKTERSEQYGGRFTVIANMQKATASCTAATGDIFSDGFE